MNKTPWYFNNVPNFECQHCGTCCRRPGYISFSHVDIAVIAHHLDLKPEELISKYSFQFPMNGKSLFLTLKSPCPFLKEDNTCLIYPVRPKQCKTYPVWEEIIKTPLQWKRHGIMCRGINKGGPCETMISIKKHMELTEEECKEFEVIASCSINNKPDENGFCKSDSCIFSKNDTTNKLIQENGCKIYLVAKKVEENKNNGEIQ